MSKRGGKAHRGRETGSTGRPAALNAKHVSVLREIVTENPSASLDAVTLQLDQRRGIKVCSKAVRNALRAVGIARVKPPRRAARNDDAPSQGRATATHLPINEMATGGDGGFDVGRKVKGRKRHLLVDTLGLLPKRWVVERTHASHQRPAIINTAVLPRFFRSLELFA